MTPTRAAAIERLEEFLPRAGSKYASYRNFDHGPDDRSNVSMLSPYLRHRLITEEEVTVAVLERHTPKAAEKFLLEVAWRTYWKGWLEMRPTVWSDYLEELSHLPKDANYQNAIEGLTGIDCFDSWVNELIEYGYLHNHTRMWFASIWIFTLRLPWQLGADFFMQNLIDADPASNTLSWRWVAGLHTRGKHYLARASNIAKYTSGRFNPAGQLNESANPLLPKKLYEAQALILPENPQARGRVGHLITPDDLAPPPLSIGPISATAIIPPAGPKKEKPGTSFLRGAIINTSDRLQAEVLDGETASVVAEWIAKEQLDLVVCSRPTVGPSLDLVECINLPLHFFVRSWDRKLWPRATAGFFKLRKSLPALQRSLTQETQAELF